MTSKLKTDVIETVSGNGTIALANQFSGMTHESMPAGHILQTVVNSTNSVNATTSTSFVSTSVTVTITPSSEDSKILILHQGMLNKQSSSQWHWATLYRDGINFGIGGSGNSAEAMGGAYNNSASDSHIPFTINYLDSPNTTLATTYTIYHKVNGGSARYNGDGWKLYITAIEIKG